MAKLVDDTVLDGALNIIKNGATRLIVASGTPTSYATAVANALATHIIAAADMAVANDASGRKLTVAEQAGITIDVGGDPTHICLTDGASVLLYQTTCTGATLVVANTVTVPAWKINIPDPT